MIYGYVRQTSETMSVEEQKQALLTWNPETRIIVEETEGTSLLRKISFQKGDSLAIWRLDILGFFTQELKSYLEDLSDKEITLVSLKEGLNTGKYGTDELFVPYLSYIAESELFVKKSRIKAGQKRGREIGNKAGPKPLISGDKEIEVNKLLAAGHTNAEVCRRLNITAQTFYKWKRG
jgi:hypothetical protein